jgi:hypothetical protein
MYRSAADALEVAIVRGRLRAEAEARGRREIRRLSLIALRAGGFVLYDGPEWTMELWREILAAESMDSTGRDGPGGNPATFS